MTGAVSAPVEGVGVGGQRLGVRWLLVDGKRAVGVQQPRQQLAISLLVRLDPQVMERILKNL